jgi:hypothetical protein
MCHRRSLELSRMHWQFRCDSEDRCRPSCRRMRNFIGPGKIPERRLSTAPADALDSPGNRAYSWFRSFLVVLSRHLTDDRSRHEAAALDGSPVFARAETPFREEETRQRGITWRNHQDGSQPMRPRRLPIAHRRRGRMPQQASASTTSLVVPMTSTWLVAAHRVTSSKIGCRQNENCDRARSRASSDATAATPLGRVLVPDTIAWA